MITSIGFIDFEPHSHSGEGEGCVGEYPHDQCFVSGAQANNVAREMVYRCGFSKRLGPVALMDTEEQFINRENTRSIANISTELAKIAFQDIEEVRKASVSY